MSEICARCNKSVFAAENPVKIVGLVFHGACFKCKVCGIKLTVKTAESAEGDVYCATHKPVPTPNQVIDTTMQTAMEAPDANKNDLNFQKSSADHKYGEGAVAVDGALNSQKPPTTVNNVNNMEVRHNGTNVFTSS